MRATSSYDILGVKTIKLAGRPRKRDFNLSIYDVDKLLHGYKIKRGGYILYIKDDKRKVYESDGWHIPKISGEYK
jgi:hypothetical protein